MDGAYDISIVDSEAGLASIRSTWESIEYADTEVTPFNTYAWLSLWWKHYAKPDFKLHVVLFSQNDQVLALAPLYIHNHSQLKVIKQKALCWLGSGGDTSPDYLNIICVPQHREAVVACFVQYLSALDVVQRIHLSDMVNPSALYDRVFKVFSERKGLLMAPVTNNIFNSDLPKSWEEYRMALSRKRRKQINHRRNRLDQAGDWSVSICESDEQRQLALKALEELHRKRWESKGQPGSFITDEYLTFHRDVIATFSRNDQLWLVTLVLNGNTIGVLYLFLWRNTLLFFQSGFSPDYESLSPGHVLFTYVIREAIERGVERIDLLKGDYQYKKVYAKSVTETTDLVYVRPGLGCLVSRSKQLVKSVLK